MNAKQIRTASLAIALLIAATPSSGAARAAELPFASVDFIEGEASLARLGRNLPAPVEGDPVFSGDFFRTQPGATLILSLGKPTGFSGTLTILGNSAVYVSTSLLKGSPRSSIDLMGGSVAAKVAKLTATPTMGVSTGNSTLVIRGTEFEIALSVNDSILVVCEEGRVSLTSEGEELAVDAGSAVEKKLGQRFAALPVTASSLRRLRETWIADEIAAFRTAPAKALAAYQQRYEEYARQFLLDIANLEKSSVLSKWLREERSAAHIDPLDPLVMREKKEISALLLELRKRLVIFERTCWRLDEVSALIIGTPAERTQLRPGLTAGAFLQAYRSQRSNLASKFLSFRHAENLYAQREGDSTGLLDTGGDFFSTQDPFFDQTRDGK